MKKQILTLFLLFGTFLSVKAQSITDLFSASSTQIYWLGIDFSHVKLIGDFSQFGEAGSIGVVGIKNDYFPSWNALILNEREKYDVAGMFRTPEIIFNTDGIKKINAEASTQDMEDDTAPNYSIEAIQDFIQNYSFGVRDGIGLLLLAESLNKTNAIGTYHFLAIDLKTNKIMLHEEFSGKASGFGLRNFWARSYYEVIIEIRDSKFKSWKKQYLPK
jgi:hypothetical protein